MSAEVVGHLIALHHQPLNGMVLHLMPRSCSNNTVSAQTLFSWFIFI